MAWGKDESEWPSVPVWRALPHAPYFRDCASLVKLRAASKAAIESRYGGVCSAAPLCDARRRAVYWWSQNGSSAAYFAGSRSYRGACR
jgi:hypothetical protein